MSLESYLAYLLALLIAVVSPGPAMIAVISASAGKGVRSGFAVAVGISLADVLLVAAALVGLAALMMAFEPALIAVKWIGGAYLIWIGIRMWREAGKDEYHVAVSSRRSLSTGFAVGLSNPKAVLFHASLMPLVIDLARVDAVAALLIMSTVALVNLLVMSGFAIAAGKGATQLRSRRGQRIMNRTAGCAMAGAGTLVIAR